MLKEGVILGERYEIISRIGSGGMADVYKAKDHKLNRMVAVKVLKPEFREDKTFIRKFRTEAQAAAGLSHPNIVNVYKLADEGLQITLALSLHAPNDEKRRELMPIANKYSIDEILDACRNYFAKTGRRITFEYSLVGGKNDSEADAKELSARISDINCHVNLIPVNPIKERDYVKSTKKVVENFKNKLEKYGINVTIRREMGADIDGACGQLRKSFIDKSNEQP